MMRLKIPVCCCALFLTLVSDLNGCDLTASIDTMLSAPRLTAEQDQIYQALQAAAGTGISLKYPKSGEHLSAFTIADLDDDGEDEAIVFYEIAAASSDENPLRVCLLDQQDGAWRAVTDHTTAGAEIEFVSIQTLGEHPRTNLILGYSMVDGAEYTAEVLHYANGTLERSISVAYSCLDVRDLDNDGTQELLAVTAATISTSAAVSVYALDASGSYYQSQVGLPDSFTEISTLLYGKIPSDDPSRAARGWAIYLDGMTGATTMQTEILTYSNRMLTLQYADSAEQFPNTNRSAGCRSMDIDRDGEIEIPVHTVFYGYNNTEETEQIPMTSWYVCRGNLLMRKSASYYSQADGYVFVLPERWERKVTAAQGDNEIVFYELGNEIQSDGNPTRQAPLLRIAVASDAETADSFQQGGYLLLRQCGEMRFFAKLESPDSALALTLSELLIAMRYL